MTTINLEKLSQQDCIKIATIAEPNVKWKVISPKNKWEGFDLIDEDSEEDEIARCIFQIDYRSDEDLQGQSRYRLYHELQEKKLGSEEINRIFAYICHSQEICIQTGISCGMPCHTDCPLSVK